MEAQKHRREVKIIANCKNCKDNEQIPEQSKNELAFAFAERMVKRLWIALIVTICLAVAAPLAVHFGWLHYERQFETYCYEQDGEGINSVNFGEQGDKNNGAESEVQEEEKPE